MLWSLGADTVKRGASPVNLTPSISSSKLKESNSSFSIKSSNNLWDSSKESYTLDRTTAKTSNGIGVKNVLFAPSVEKSSSSYLLNDQQHTTNLNHSNSITPSSSTSQLIKQTLSPLVHQRHNQPTSNSVSDTKNAVSPLKMKPNNVSPFVGNYQLSNTFIMTNNNGNGNKNNYPLSTSMDNGSNNIPIQKTASTSRSLSSHTNTNTLPSHVGRSNNQYQFESNYLLKNKPKNFTSPENTSFFNALSSISSSNASVTIANQHTSTASIMAASTSAAGISNNSAPSNNIYGTLPKSINAQANSNATGAIYGNVSAVANEFEQLIARNASGNSTIGNNTSATSNNYGNYNTLGSYRVQYSATNPFLNHFNPSSNDTNADS